MTTQANYCSITLRGLKKTSGIGRMIGFMLKHLSLTLALLIIPRIALSAGILEIADTIAGIGTTVTLRGAEPNASVPVSVVPPYGPTIALSAKTDAMGTAHVRIDGADTEVAGQYAVTADGGNGSASIHGIFDVNPDSIDGMASTLETSGVSLQANGSDEITVRAVMRDRYGNPVPSRRIELISNRPGDAVGALTGETDDRGEQLFSVRTVEPGVIDLRAMDLLSSKLLGSSVTLQAKSLYGIGGNAFAGAGRTSTASAWAPSPSYGYGPTSNAGRRFYGQIGNTFDVVHTFEIILDRGVKEVAVYDPLSLEIRAVDRSGNVVEDYTGTVQIFTTDPEALLPSEVRFTPGDFGVKRLSLSLLFQTPGEPNTIGKPTHVVRVEEVGTCASPSSINCVFGELEVIVGGGSVTGDPERRITVTTPVPGGTVNTPNITVEGKGPPFVNLEITGGAQDVFGETDSDGKFAMEIDLDSRLMEHTLRVRDVSGRFDSGNIRVVLDSTAPEIGEVTFDPSSPEGGATVTVTVQSEPGLPSTIIVIHETETKLAPSKTLSGTYTGTFTAPGVGSTMAIVRATDSAGNEAQARIQLTVVPQALPKVTGVRATPKIEQVDLTWSPVDDRAVDGYRIYVGTESKDYSSFLDSTDPRGGATIGGLKPGTTYYFAVTAMQGDRESKEKSHEVSAIALGLTLDITPQDGGLMLEWSSLDTDIPLSSFILEYGVEVGNYTEKRTLNGDLRAYALRDLLNDVTYALRLTPVTTTGDLLEDLAAEGQGAPVATGNGFQPTPADPVPFSTTIGGPVSGATRSIPSSGTIHSSAPSTPGVGLPPIAWWIAGSLATVACYVHWQRRKTMQMTLRFLQTMETNYRNC